MSTGHFHFSATNEEVWQILKTLDWRLYDAGFCVLGKERDYLPIEELQQHLMGGGVSTVYIRYKTGLEWNTGINEGRYAGYLVLVLPSIISDKFHIGSLSFWDTNLNPTYSSPKPIFYLLRKLLKRICIHELEGKWVTSGAKAKVSDGAVEIRQSGFKFIYANQILDLKDRNTL